MEENTIWMKIISMIRIGNTHKERVILAYGLSKVTYLFINFILICIVGIIIGDISNCIGYLITFYFLRKYAGGYHAPSKTICLIVTCVIEIGAIGAICVTRINAYSFALYTVISVLIYLYAPIESANKPLTTEEKKLYRNKTFIIVATCYVISLLNYLIGNNNVNVGILVAMIEVIILMFPTKLSKNNNL